MLLIIVAGVLVIVALIATDSRMHRCPHHGDIFDALTCSLCSVLMHREAEIKGFCECFAAGHVPRSITYVSRSVTVADIDGQRYRVITD
jgi:hypothetical protein